VSISLAVVTVQFAARLLSINLIRHAHFGTSERPAEYGCEPRSTNSHFHPLRCALGSLLCSNCWAYLSGVVPVNAAVLRTHSQFRGAPDAPAKRLSIYWKGAGSSLSPACSGQRSCASLPRRATFFGTTGSETQCSVA
jgi:hypothetical protein